MNRRNFITHIGAAGLSMAITSRSFADDQQKESPAVPAPIPELQNTPAVYAPTPDGATIIWPVTAYSAGWVEYGESGSSEPSHIIRADGFGFVPHDERVLRVRLTGLKPGRLYWYRTHTRPVYTSVNPPANLKVQSSKTYMLRVLDVGAAETRFCIWNDTHDHENTLARLGELTRAEHSDFLIWNGDVANYISEEISLPGLFLQPKGVSLAELPPILLTCGNHDVRGPAANRVPAYVAFPDGRPYYSFRVGPVAAIVLDTGEDKPDNHPSFFGLVDFEPLIREQARWLAEEINKSHLKSAPYKLLICHIPLRWKTETTPIYDDAGNDYDHWSRRGREAWHDSLVRWGAQLVISGHTHEWCHMPATAEFPYGQLIGGGPSLLDETIHQTAILIQAYANADALTFRLINAATNKEIFQTQVVPQRVK